MKQCPTSVWQHPASEEENRTWGHDFNAAGMFANNQGQAEDALWDGLRCPAGVTGCCGVFRPRQPYPPFRASSARSHPKRTNLVKRKVSI
jgi:hypothetical protein